MNGTALEAYMLDMERARALRGGYRQFRGWRWLVGKVALALPGSFTCGACFGALNALGLVIGTGDPVGGDVAFFLLMAGCVGAVVGAASFPLLIAVTTSTRANTGYAWVLAGTGAAAFVLGALSDPDKVVIGVAITLLVYACACIGWRVYDGSGAYVLHPGRCPGCGYDLHGLAAGPCPECGHALDP